MHLIKKYYINFPVLLVAIALFYHYGRAYWYPVKVSVMGARTVSEVISNYGEQARNNLKPLFDEAGVAYPPTDLALIAYKDTNQLEVWAADTGQHFKKVVTYPIQAASGVLGPKLREGDRQVPEGMYQITGFNPNSSYHLSMKLNYPNAFDLQHAKNEGRDQPGSNIFIHGKAVSIGCLAMGDEVIENLFTLVYDTGRSHTQVIISPTNPKVAPLTVPKGAPGWVADLYLQITGRIASINSL